MRLVWWMLAAALLLGGQSWWRSQPARDNGTVSALDGGSSFPPTPKAP